MNIFFDFSTLASETVVCSLAGRSVPQRKALEADKSDDLVTRW